MNTLSFFEKNTDAPGTNRGFLFQYLNTLKLWLEIYKTSDTAKLYCEVEDDVKEINLNGISFSQFKCYSSSFSFSSSEIKKSFCNFYCLFFKYFDSNPQFHFYTNSSVIKSEKTLINWANYQDNLKEDLIQEIVLTVQPIVEKEFDDQFQSEYNNLTDKISKLDTNEKLTEEKKKHKKLELETQLSQATAQLLIVKTHIKSNITKFIKSVSFTFLNEKPEISVNVLEEECIALIRSIPDFTHIERLFFCRLLTEIYKRSSNGEINKRLLDKDLLKTIASESTEEIEKRCNTTFLNLIGRLDKIDDRLDDLDAKISNQSQISKILNSTPFMPEIFIGREKELEDLYLKLFNEDSLVLLVNGEGGIGKTSLASKYYSKYLQHYSHAAWVFVDSSISDALLDLCSVLGIKFDERNGQISVQNRMEILIKKLAQLDKPCLLIIDDANNLEDLGQWYALLRTCINFHILLTTRITSFLQAKSHIVNPLTQEQAIELFKIYYTNHDNSEDHILNDVLEAIGYNTLVIELLAKNLKNFNNELVRKYGLNDLLLDIQKRGLLNLTQSNEVTVYYKDKTPKLISARPEEIVQAMYSLVSLEDKEKLILSVFSVLPSESISFKNLKSLLHNIDSLDTELLQLYQKGWIEYNKNSRAFKCNPIVQEITRNANKTRLSSDINVLVDNLCSSLDINPDTWNITNAENNTAIEYVRYAESIINVVDLEGADICFLAGKIGEFFKVYGNINKSIKYFLIYLERAKKLSETDNLKDSYKLSNAYFSTAEAYERVGEYSKALKYYNEDLQLNKEFSENEPEELLYKGNLAELYGKLSEINSKLGLLKEEDEFFKLQSQVVEELNIIESDNAMFLYSLAISNEKVGTAFLKRENKKHAFSHFKKYHDLSKLLIANKPENVKFKVILAVSCNKLGDYYLRTEVNITEAFNYNNQFYDIVSQLSAEDPKNSEYKNLLAIACEKKGVMIMDENLDEAISFFKRKESLLDELCKNNPEDFEYQNQLGITYEKIGDAYHKQKRRKEAVTYYKKYFELTTRLSNEKPDNPEFIEGLMFAHTRLATSLLFNDEINEAEQISIQSKNLINELIIARPENLLYKYQITDVYILLFEIYNKKKDLQKFCSIVKEASALAIDLYKKKPDNARIQKFLNNVSKANKFCSN